MTTKILLSAYACEPHKGSEPEVGLQAALAAATFGDVWVLTRTNNLPSLTQFLESHPAAPQITLVGLELSSLVLWFKKRLGAAGLVWYYDAWQRKAARKAEELDATVGFDLVHHVTFATYWGRCAVAGLGKPFVLGPVGGGVEAPIRLLPELGWRGLLREAVRYLIRAAAGRRNSVKRAIALATVSLAQNPETAAKLAGGREVLVVPNGVAAKPSPPTAGSRRRDEVLLVGRLLPYKAGTIAVRVLSQLKDSSVRLVVFGDGPERDRMQRLATKLGMADRVEFAGAVPRETLFTRIAEAAAVLHPALHDDSPLSIAEALALRTPVVCLDRGGPPVIRALFPDSPATVVAATGSRRELVAALTAAVDHYVSDPAPAFVEVSEPTVSFAESLIAAYRKAIGSDA